MKTLKTDGNEPKVGDFSEPHGIYTKGSHWRFIFTSRSETRRHQWWLCNIPDEECLCVVGLNADEARTFAASIGFPNSVRHEHCPYAVGYQPNNGTGYDRSEDPFFEQSVADFGYSYRNSSEYQ